MRVFEHFRNEEDVLPAHDSGESEILDPAIPNLRPDVIHATYGLKRRQREAPALQLLGATEVHLVSGICDPKGSVSGSPAIGQISTQTGHPFSV